MSNDRVLVSMSVILVAAALLVGLPRVAPADCPGASCSGGVCLVNGISNAPLGNASLAIDASCRLVVSGVGSTGHDGVVQTNLNSLYMRTDLASPNFSLSGVGTSAEIRQVGVAGGQGGRELSLTSIVNVSGTTLRLFMDCGAVGVQRYSVQFYLGGVPQNSVDLGTNPATLLLPPGDLNAMACAILPNGDLYTTMSFGGAVPFTVQLPSGNQGPFVADCVRLNGFDPQTVPTLQESIENRFRLTGPVSVAAVEAGPLPASDTVCPDGPIAAERSTWTLLKARYR